MRPSPLRGSTIALAPPLQLTSHRFQRSPGAIPSSFAGTGAIAMDGGGNSIMVSQSTDASPVDSSATTAATLIDDLKQNLTQVINSIQKTIGTLHQLYLTISSYNVVSQLPLLQCMNNLVLELDNMTRLAEKCNIQVPMEVLNLIDEGKNPDEFTRDMLNGCIAKNQITKGKTDAFKGLRKHLLEELEQTFPGEVETYREIRAASAAEAKRYAQSQNMLPNGDAKIKTEI